MSTTTIILDAQMGVNGTFIGGDPVEKPSGNDLNKLFNENVPETTGRSSQRQLIWHSILGGACFAIGLTVYILGLIYLSPAAIGIGLAVYFSSTLFAMLAINACEDEPQLPLEGLEDCVREGDEIDGLTGVELVPADVEKV